MTDPKKNDKRTTIDETELNLPIAPEQLDTPNIAEEAVPADVESEAGRNGVHDEAGARAVDVTPATKPEAEHAAAAEEERSGEPESDSSVEEGSPLAELDDADPNTGIEFAAAHARTGEFLVRQSQLLDWPNHPRRGSRLKAAHASALALTAANPALLRPIEVFEAPDGNFFVKDGRFLLAAIRSANQRNEDVEVRCVAFPGGEAEAIAAICDDAMGSVEMTDIEKARALLSLQLTSGVSQVAMAERYQRLSLTKINNMLRAARVWSAYPGLFTVLAEPDRAPIDYGVKLFTFIRQLDTAGLRDLLERAEDLDANGERFTPNEALVALQVEPGIGEPSPTTSDEAAEPEDQDAAEPIFGADDQQIGHAEELASGCLSLVLPAAADITAMSVNQREEAVAAFVKRVRVHFGLEGEG